MKPAPKIAIVYNAYEPRPTAAAERLSEESVAEMAQEAHDAVRSIGIAATLVPLQRSLLNFLGRVKEVAPDALINLCEGFYGRPQWESNVAGVFELLGLTFTGNASKTLALCQDKFRAKAVLRAAGLPTAPAQVMRTGDEPLEVVAWEPRGQGASAGHFGPEILDDARNQAPPTGVRGFPVSGRMALVENFILLRMRTNGSVARENLHSFIDSPDLPNDCPMRAFQSSRI